MANVYSSIGNGLYGSDGGSVHTFQEFSSDASIIPGRQGDWVDGGAWLQPIQSVPRQESMRFITAIARQISYGF